MGFGKSSSKSNQQSQNTSASYNQAYPMLSESLGSTVGQAATGSNAIASLLGVGGAGAAGQTEAFNNFKNSSGYDFIRNEGVNGITSSNAAKGLLGSGSTLKSIGKYSSNLAQNFLNSYLQNLSGLASTGIQAGQVIGSAGSTANSQGTSYGSSKASSMNGSLG